MTEVGDRLERAIEERADVEHEIERGEASPPARQKIVRSVFWLAVTGISLYLVAPSLIDVLGSWDDLDELSPAWLALMFALQTASLACLWALQYLAMQGPTRPAVVTSQLAGNALAKVAPGGGAVGAALQYRMLVRAGLPRRRAVAGLTATNLLVFAAVLAMPVLAVPAILRGGVNRDLLEATAVGVVVFVALFGIGAVLIAYDGVLAWVGRVIQGVRNRVRRHAEPLRTLPQRLLRERDRIVGTFGDALDARAGGHQRPLGVRLRHSPGRARGRRVAAAPVARPARLLRGAGARADPDHPRWPRVRRGGPDGDARARRRPGGRRGARHVRVPAVLVLAAAAGRPRGVRLARAALPRGGLDRDLIGRAAAP